MSIKSVSEALMVYDKEKVMEGQSISEDFKAFKEDKGKKFDEGKPMIGLISAYAIEQEARVMTFGAGKYGFHNWRAGLSWLRVISAVLRHIFAFLRGEDFDPETGIHHLAHARCGLAFILEYTQTHPEKDDRAK